MKKRIGTAQMIILAIGVVGETFLTATIGSYAMIFFAPTEETGLPLLLPIGAIGIIQGIGFAFDCLIGQLKKPKGQANTHDEAGIHSSWHILRHEAGSSTWAGWRSAFLSTASSDQSMTSTGTP